MGAGVIDSVVALSNTLSDSDRLELVRRLLGGVAASGEGVVASYPTGYILYAEGEDATYECSSWLLAPGTNLANRPFLAFIYLVGLAYVFLGIAIISDIFMAAIEVITASEGTRRVRTNDGKMIEYTFKIFNPTVANLTLMALGSSAPEILLAIIGVISTLDDTPDELGPSTIVGSAAFNLLLISAICISALPEGETKKIDDLNVFLVTAFFSVAAYVWLYIVLQVSSPHVVELWEAFFTLGLFGVLLSIAYLVDVRGRCCSPPKHVAPQLLKSKSGVEIARRSSVQLMADLRKTQEEVTLRHMPAAGAGLEEERPSHGTRGHFMRSFTGQRRLTEHIAAPEGEGTRLGMGMRLGGCMGEGGIFGGKKTVELKKIATPLSSSSPVRTVRTTITIATSDGSPHNRRVGAPASEEPLVYLVSFDQTSYTVAAAWGSAVAVVTLEPPCAERVVAQWRAWALGGSDNEKNEMAKKSDSDSFSSSSVLFKESSGEVVFEAGQRTALIEVPLIETSVPSRGRAAFELVISHGAGEGASKGRVHLGVNARTSVHVVGAGAQQQPNCGTVKFFESAVMCEESCGVLLLSVMRVEGWDGSLEVGYATREGTAKAGSDFVAKEGRLTFAPGQTQATIGIEVVDDDVAEDDEQFTCELLHVGGGPNVLAEEDYVCTVTILDDDTWKFRLRRKKAQLRAALAQSFYAADSWSDRFKDALTLSGAVDDETGDETPPSGADSFMHALSLFWKLQFALIPPEAWGMGWPAFITSLIFIGIWTAIVGELASLFGCVIGLGDAITAITFVALGTSLPDTFASRLATLHDEHADAAIGNITGSNSVNVFLGLGIPWIIGALYHRYAPRGKGQYDVPAGSLGFSLALFSTLAAVALLTLLVRRHFNGGELGGSRKSTRLLSLFFVSLWVIYIVLASLNDKGYLADL